MGPESGDSKTTVVKIAGKNQEAFKLFVDGEQVNYRRFNRINKDVLTEEARTLCQSAVDGGYEVYFSVCDEVTSIVVFNDKEVHYERDYRLTEEEVFVRPEAALVEEITVGLADSQRQLVMSAAKKGYKPVPGYCSW